MKRLMRYRIKAGRVIEKRDVLMEVSLDPEDRRPRPRGKRRGKSLASQIERNMREAVKRLARILNCNFKGGDLLLTLKYDNARLPADKKAAKREVRNFLRRLDRAHRAATGRRFRWVMVTADHSSRTGEQARLHHHIVMDPVDWEWIAANWPADQFSYRRLDNRGDYTAVALYMVRNTGYQRGERSWSSCKGLEKPEFFPPEPVRELGSFRVPRDGVVTEREVREDAESGFYGAYIRYVMPEGKAEDWGARELGPERGRAQGRAAVRRPGRGGGKATERSPRSGAGQEFLDAGGAGAIQTTRNTYGKPPERRKRTGAQRRGGTEG